MLHILVMKNFKVWKKLMLLGVVFLIPALAAVLALVLQRQWEQVYQAIAIEAAGFVLLFAQRVALVVFPLAASDADFNFRAPVNEVQLQRHDREP